MMMRYRDRFYKKIILLCVLLIAASCSRQQKLKFCEKPEGENEKPAACGSKFSTGELSIVLKSSKEIGVDTLEYRFFTEESSDKMPVNVVKTETKPEARTVVTHVELYNPGSFRVIAVKPDGTAVAQGRVTVIDVE